MTQQKYCITYMYSKGVKLIIKRNYIDKKTYNRISDFLYNALRCRKISLIDYDNFNDYFLSKNGKVEIVISR